MSDDYNPPFEILEPRCQLAPLLFNAPHAGRVYPPSFLAMSRLDKHALRRSEDSFVDLIFDGVVALGAPLMRAHFPRAYLDVNREPYELDPRMFEGRLPSYANTRSLRVAGGLGTIAKVVGESQEIYNRRLTVPEGLERIERLYKPYHRALRCRVQEIVQDFGLAVLIDCHSMPSASLPSERHSRPDIVLGDRYGTSCSPVLTDVVEHTLRQMGYRVHRNKPYAGGYITESYGNPQAGMHALQIEINRALYMDEAAIEPTAGLKKLNADFALLCDGLLRLDLSNGPYRAAAE